LKHTVRLPSGIALISLAALLVASQAQGAVTTRTIFNTAGAKSWTCPAGVTSIQVECWGGGGAGGLGQVVLTYTTVNDPAVVKANNTDNLNLGSSWVGGAPPASTKAAQWDSTVTAANVVSLGADTTWKGIQILNPGGNVAINSGNTLTLDSMGLGLDLSAATKDLTLNCPLVVGGNHIWSVGLGRALTLAGGISGTPGVNLQGSGTFKLPNPGSGLTQTLSGTLTVATADATLLSDYNGGSGTLSTALGTPSRNVGSTLNISVVGGPPGTNNLVKLTGAAGFVDAGVFYNSADFAWRDAVDGYVRAPVYGTDANTINNPASPFTFATASHLHLVGSESATVSGGNLNPGSIKIEGGGGSLNISSATCTPAVLKTGGGVYSMSGTVIRPPTTGGNLVLRMEGSTDPLVISGSNPLPGILTVSGARTVTYNSTPSVTSIYVNGGTLEFGSAASVGGVSPIFINSGALLYINTTAAQTIQGGISGAGNLTKNNSGTTTLSAANTFSGTTKVLGGMITLNQALTL
jgi:fibronectin-binding autotransporter adhesin